VHAEMTSSNAMSGTAGACDDPIGARYQATTGSRNACSGGVSASSAGE
jgi:hypothetical protein